MLRGADCPFAHSKEELQPMPDLMKTKMCYNYFRRCEATGGKSSLEVIYIYISPYIYSIYDI